MAQGSGQQRKLGAIEPEVLMSPAQAEQITIDIKAGLDRVDELVAETAVKIADAKKRGAWRVLGFDTWGEYVREEFGTERRYANRLVRYGEMVELLTEASRGALGPRGVQEALPEKGFRALPDETLERLPADVAAAVKGKHAPKRADAALAVLAEARKVVPSADPPQAAPNMAEHYLPPNEPVGVLHPDDAVALDAVVQSPQVPPPSTGMRNADTASADPSPPAAAVLETGSPPPERTTPAPESGRVGVRGFDAPPVPKPGPVAVRAALDLLAKTSVEELQAAGHVRLRDAADRLAAADGRKLVTLDEWAETRAELRRLREAPTLPSKAPRAGKAVAVASGGRSGAKTPITPPTSSPTGACTHPAAQWNRLAYGVFCGVPGCGVKVR